MISLSKTGIDGLDKALNGGIPESNIVIVSGGAGTGKSTLCLQYILNGAAKYGEKSLYISTEQTREELLKQGESFGWDIEKLEKLGRIKIVHFDITTHRDFVKSIDDVVREFKPKRIAIDSLTTLTDALLISDISEQTAFSLAQIAETVTPIPRTEQVIAKTILYQLMKNLREYKITTLLTSELYEDTNRLSADGVSEFIADGVILMFFIGIAGSDSRTLRIRKMRYCEHLKSYLPYEIKNNEGIVVNTEESMDVLMK
ncbi:MAG: ATPase domain-containing protein [archaeon]